MPSMIVLCACSSAWGSLNVLDLWVYSFFQFGNFKAIFFSDLLPSDIVLQVTETLVIYIWSPCLSVLQFGKFLLLYLQVHSSFFFLGIIQFFKAYLVYFFLSEIPFVPSLQSPFFSSSYLFSFKFLGMFIIALLAFSSVIWVFSLWLHLLLVMSPISLLLWAFSNVLLDVGR